MSSKLKRVRVDEDSDDEDQPIKRSRKKQIIESDDESPVKKKKSKAKDDSDFEAMETETQSDDDMQSEPATESEPESEVEESPKKKPKKKPAAKAKTVSNKSLNMASFMADNDEEVMGAQWEHEKQEWLKPENIRDANKNRPDSAEYDPTTLYVPPEYIKKLTPGMGNWWKIKSRNYDTVIYYKVGKFYELYHMDAVSGVNVCGLTYMKARVKSKF